jgi:hypothetical protein
MGMSAIADPAVAAIAQARPIALARANRPICVEPVLRG